MAIKYTRKTKVFCRFKGDDLKAAMDNQGLSAWMLAKVIGVYPGKVKGWEESKYVTVEADVMDDINTTIDCATTKKIL